jgi:hypothetical protein
VHSGGRVEGAAASMLGLFMTQRPGRPEEYRRRRSTSAISNASMPSAAGRVPAPPKHSPMAPSVYGFQYFSPYGVAIPSSGGAVH